MFECLKNFGNKSSAIARIPSAEKTVKDYLAPYKWAVVEMKTHDTREIPGKVNNPRIVWYHDHTSLDAADDETPWCSSFMNTAAQETGFESTRSAAARSWENFGDEGDGSIGDIAVFTRQGGGHVAFVNQPYKKGDKTINILGGNQHNCLCVEDRDSSTLLSIRRFKA